MIGQHIQNYHVTAHLGEGGMGIVYRANDTVLGRDVALKMLHAPLLSQPQFLERFRKEARVLAQLLHPNIAVIYNFIEQNASHYMVMEYVEGLNLDSLLRKHTQLSHKIVVPVFIQALEGLQHAHKKGIYHRDIKPANLILTPDGTVKLMDFGIAKVAGEQRLTQVNRVVGTIEFMAPELIQGADPSVASDIYATGITMYELLSGRLPFENSTDYNLMQEILKKRPASIEQLNPSIPKALGNVVMKAIEKRPENRYTNARAFQQALIAAFPALQEIDMGLLAAPSTQSIQTTGSIPVEKPTVLLQATRMEKATGQENIVHSMRQKLMAYKKPLIAGMAGLATLLVILSLVLKKDPEAELILPDTERQPPVTISTNTAIEEQKGTIPSGNILPPVVNNELPQPPVEVPEKEKKEKAVNKPPKDDKKQEQPAPVEKKEPVEEQKTIEPPVTREEKVIPAETNRPARTMKLTSKLEVALYLQETITVSNAKQGLALHFTVTKPVTVNGETIIERGAAAAGFIKNLNNKKISILLTHVTSINGERLPFQETELSGRIEEILSSRDYSGFLKKGTTIHF